MFVHLSLSLPNNNNNNNNGVSYDLLLNHTVPTHTAHLLVLSHRALVTVGRWGRCSTFHVLVEPEGHAHVADLDGFEVAHDHHVARLHVAVEQLLLVVEVL